MNHCRPLRYDRSREHRRRKISRGLLVGLGVLIVIAIGIVFI